MKRNFRLIFPAYWAVIKTALKLSLNALIYGLWLVALMALMWPYQAYRAFVPKDIKESSKVSKFFRKVFEHRRARRAVGVGLAMIILLSGFIGNILAAGQTEAAEATLMASPQAEVITENSLEKPIEGIVAQGYHAFHRAIDILAPIGMSIMPIAEGEVIEASFGRLGWGNTVVIEHGKGLVSRYAHLKDIYVTVGGSVDKNTVIGNVGMTGWTTGPHLHLEVYQDGRAIDPQAVLPEFNHLIARAE